MTLRNQIRVVSNAVTFAPLTSFMPIEAVPGKKRRQRSVDLLHHKRPLQQLLSLALVVYISLRTRSDSEICAGLTNSDKNYSADRLSVTEDPLCPARAFLSFSISSGLSLVFEILHKNLRFSSRYIRAASKTGHTYIAARAFAAHSR